MNYSRVTAAFFSPTGGTKACVEALARELSPDFQTLDLTLPEARSKDVFFPADELVIFGAPVYAGRLPPVAGGLFTRLRGQGTAAVFVVSYGNRAFDDALLEMQDLCTAQGFLGVAAAACIAPHSFSAQIAAHRPDASDLQKIKAFAGQIQVLGPVGPRGALHVPGKRPYRSGVSGLPHPEGDARCTRCGRCAASCPTGAITAETPAQTEADTCIACLACVRVCPEHARGINAPAFAEKVRRLEEMLMDKRQEPEFFLAE